MSTRLRQFLHSLAYAGLKPGERQAGPKVAGERRSKLERWLRGGKSDDPLYLSNRTFAQKMRPAIVIALPFLIAGGFVAVAMYVRDSRGPAEEMLSEGPGRKVLLPHLNTIKVDTNHDVEVVEAGVHKIGGMSISGIAVNNTGRRIASAELVFDLTDQEGSQLGGVSTTVKDLAPKATVAFEFPIKQEDAVFVIVREVILH